MNKTIEVHIAPPKEVDWLVIFLVLDTTDLDEYLEVFFENLSPIKLRKTTKIYFLKDTVHRMRSPRLYFRHWLQLYELLYDEAAGKVIKKEVNITGVNPTDGLAYLDAIGQLYTIINAQFNALITWSHGSGLGVANRLEPYKVRERKYNLVRNFQQRTLKFQEAMLLRPGVKVAGRHLYIKRNIFKVDCPGITHLFISDIGKGLEVAMQQKKFDMIIMCNCANHVIDNCYNLHKVARYYFAPMGGIQLDGYDFPAFIELINNGGKMAEQLRSAARHSKTKARQKDAVQNEALYKAYFAEIIRKLFDGYKKLAPVHHESEAIVVSDLTQMGLLPGFLDPLGDYLLNNRDQTYPIVLAILKTKISMVYEYDIFDIVSVISLIRDELNSSEFTGHADRFIHFLTSEIFVDMMVGKKVFLVSPPKRIRSMAAWMPPKVTSRLDENFVCQNFHEYLESPFIMATNWDLFVRDFILWQKGKAADS